MNNKKVSTIIASIFICFFVLMICSIINDNSIILILFSMLLSYAIPIVVIVLIVKTVSKNRTTTSSSLTNIRIETVMIKCPKCGRLVNAANDHCPDCFTKLDHIDSTCPKCGFKNVSNAKFCRECGTELKIIEKKVLLGFPLDCPKCHKPLTEKSNICEHCGKDIGDFIEEKMKEFDASYGTPVNSSEFDSFLLNASESQVISELIKKELEKNPSAMKMTIPKMERTKYLVTLIYALIIFILISIYVFYHTYGSLDIIIFLIVSIFYVLLTKKYSLSKYIQSEVKKRPDTKISYIVSSAVSQASPTNKLHILFRTLLVCLVFVGCYFLYKEPHYIYEHQENGYALRYYTYGLVNKEKEIVIPETYKNEPVIGIRGDTFKNVRSIVSVYLPDTITEIRGGAFQNCTSLTSINIPPKVTEIHGSTFENCYSLRSIIIPEGVTRIGGSAFRNCISLKEATIPSTVKEIGSSAFRRTALKQVCISNSTYVNERAFKETYVSIGYYENNCLSNYIKEDDYQYDY